MKQIGALILFFLIALLSYHGGITGFAIKPLIVEETGPEPRVYFCNKVDCSQKFQEEFEDATSLDCAFFEIESEQVLQTLEEKGARLVTDKRKEVPYDSTVYDTSSAYMHNKFCIDDRNRVWTGSWNAKDNTRQRNNVIVFDSKIIAEEYAREFEELWRGTFNGGATRKVETLIFNGKPIKMHFCPEDNCQEAVIREINKAKNEIVFMTFSFTDAKIAQAMQHVPVRGIFEPMNTRYSQYDAFENARYDRLPGLLHHKTIIIDDHTVITGSYNPSKNGNTRNDENMIIINDPEIAQLFLVEFEEVWATSTPRESSQ